MLAELPNSDRKSVPRERPPEYPQNTFTTFRNLTVDTNSWDFKSLVIFLNIFFTIFPLHNFEFGRRNTVTSYWFSDM